MNAPTTKAYSSLPDQIGWRRGQDVWLESPNYFMRSMTPEDASDRLLSWMADPAVMVPLGEAARKYTREELIKHIRYFDNVDKFLLGIFVKETGLLIGWRSIEHNAEAGGEITHLAIGDESYRGRGVNFELQDAVYGFMFYTIRAQRMVATVYSDNMRMRRRAERAGYRVDHSKAERNVGTDGKTRDVIWFKLSERDWRARRKWVYALTWRAGYQTEGRAA